MNDTTSVTSSATAALASLFLDIVSSGDGITFEQFEERSIRLGHEIMAQALGRALEHYDNLICDGLPEGHRIHDKRVRTLATEVGDVSFAHRRVRDGYGLTHVPLADDLDLPWGCRVSPGATAFLVEAGAEVSYLKAARLLARKGGSQVSPTTVMRSLRRTGSLCEMEDESAAKELFGKGVIPAGEAEASQMRLEADGTWIKLQGVSEDEPQRVEVKALVAYSDKIGCGKKVKRAGTVRHGCVGAPDAFWTQGIAAIGTRYDLAKIDSCHLGTDGEAWCKRGTEFLPGRIEVTGHIDPFHVDRAVLSCFQDKKAAWRVLEVVREGDVEQAACLIEASREFGLAREKQATRTIGYLRNNAELICAAGPSLGTMESEVQHLYSSRMESVPCAWSIQGVSDMARIRSRIYSKRSLPRPTREQSITPRKRVRRENRMLGALSKKGAGRVVQSEGHGYEPPHNASVIGKTAEVRYAAGVDSGMVGIG